LARLSPDSFSRTLTPASGSALWRAAAAWRIAGGPGKRRRPWFAGQLWCEIHSIVNAETAHRERRNRAS